VSAVVAGAFDQISSSAWTSDPGESALGTAGKTRLSILLRSQRAHESVAGFVAIWTVNTSVKTGTRPCGVNAAYNVQKIRVSGPLTEGRLPFRRLEALLHAFGNLVYMRTEQIIELHLTTHIKSLREERYLMLFVHAVPDPLSSPQEGAH
jgi:hypothetical protein